MNTMTKALFGLALAVSTSAVFAGPVVQLDRLNIGNAGNTNAISGSSNTGGVFKWRIRNMTSVTGTDFEWLDQEFYAMCLEPVETLSNGYFEIVDLADAPSNPGPIGPVYAENIESIISSAGWDSFGDLTGNTQEARDSRTAMQMVLWEYTQEQTDGFYDRSSGDFQVSSNAGSEAAASTFEGYVGDEITAAAFALVSVKSDGNGGWVNRGRQDFVFFDANPPGNPTNPIENPIPVAPAAYLIGLGIVGMVGVRRFVKKNSS